MASAREKIRDAFARGEYERARAADGVQISLSHQGAAGTTLWARIDDVDVSVSGPDGFMRERTERVWRIARQTGFSGTIAENDEITYSGTVYVVRSWRTEHHEGVYVVSTDAETVRRSGSV